MRNPRMIQRSAIGIGVAIFAAALGYVALAADSAKTEKIPAAADSSQYAAFMENEAFDLEDLAEGAEIQRRMFNRMTPPGVSLIQPMFPAVVPFDAANFDESFLGDLLGEDKNSVSVYPLSLVLDPKTRETLVYNAEGSLVAVLPADGKNRIWPKGADPSRVHLRMDLLPVEDVEPYLYAKTRVEDALAAQKIAKSKKLGGTASKSLGTGEFGICGIRKTTNGTMLVSVTNGADIAEVFAYTVAHTSSVAVATWTNEYDEVITDTNVLWHPVSPPFNGKKSTWTNRTTNLALTGGAGVWEDINISSNDRVRFYAAAKRSDADADGLSDGMEAYVFHTNPDNYDSDGDFLPDAWEAGWGLSPCVSNSPTSDWDSDGLCDRDEYRYCTDPNAVDTDGDGTNDGAEVSQQPPTNPSTPDEVYDPTNCSTFNLTVGDPSGSASERWEFVFREADSGRVVIRHMDGGFGVPATKTYTLDRGHYIGTVQWIASKRSSPDYDWRAWINNRTADGPYDGLVNTACFLVADPDSLLTTDTQGNSQNLAEGREVDLLIPYSCECNIDVEQKTINVGRSSGSATLNVTSNSQAQGDFIWTSEPTGIYGTGRSIAFCPSNLLHDEYMVTCRSSGDADCFDVCFVNLLRIEIITPAGDPVNSPADSGDGQNEFTFSTNSPGVLTMNLKAQVIPTGFANLITNKVHFSVAAISGSTMAWNAANPGGRPMASGDYLVATATFTGLPSDNSALGGKMAAVYCDGSKQDEKAYEVFYYATAANHPGGTATDPNWFYYYKQNAGGGAYTYKSSGRSDCVSAGGDATIGIANEAYAGDEYIRTWVIGGQLEAIAISGTTKYYANFLGVLAHERQHANNQTNAGPPTDADSDRLSNTFETNTSQTDPNNSYSARGVLTGADSTDQEVYAGGPVEEAAISGADTSNDWADPGTNSKP